MLATAEVLTVTLNNLTGLGASRQITAYTGSAWVSSNEHDSLQTIQRQSNRKEKWREDAGTERNERGVDTRKRYPIETD